MNILITSLNFNPGHFSHLVANYKLFEEGGFESYLYINKTFNQMDEANEFKKINDSSSLKKLKDIKAAVFWFPSTKNILEILRLKIFYKSKIIFVHHEPFDSIKKYYDSGFRFKKILKIILVNCVNIPVILLADAVILPSRSSFALYEKKDAYLNRNYVSIPLLFDDEAKLDRAPTKKYISYIGTVAADHAFDRYVVFVEAAIKNTWFPEMTFLIATASIIPKEQREILEPLMDSGRIVISEGHPMKNSEINSFFRESQVVWNAYNRSMQSGVLPKAFMFGAAVLMLRRNANEFLDNDITGVLINDNKNLLEIKKAIEDIISDKENYFKNCRKKFLNTFYYKNKIEKYSTLISENKKRPGTL